MLALNLAVLWATGTSHKGIQWDIAYQNSAYQNCVSRRISGRKCRKNHRRESNYGDF